MSHVNEFPDNRRPLHIVTDTRLPTGTFLTAK